MYHLVFDIGGTKMRLGISSDGENIGKYEVIPTPKTFEEGMLSINSFLDKYAIRNEVRAAAGGIAGPVDKEKSMLVGGPNLPGWIGKPLRDELSKILDAPVFIENDTAIIGIGEAVRGAGMGKSIVAYLTVSTGVGGCRIVDGKVDRSSLGFEPGHQIIVPNGKFHCGCGIDNIGHLESCIGGAMLEKHYGKKLEDIKDPKVFEEAAKYLAYGLNNIVVFWSPDVIVLGGSVMKSIPLDRIQFYLNGIVKIFPSVPEVKLATLGDFGGFYGALTFLKESITVV